MSNRLKCQEEYGSYRYYKELLYKRGSIFDDQKSEKNYFKITRTMILLSCLVTGILVYSRGNRFIVNVLGGIHTVNFFVVISTYLAIFNINQYTYWNIRQKRYRKNGYDVRINSFIYLGINLPWILICIFLKRRLTKLKLEKIFDYASELLCAFSYSLILSSSIVMYLYNFLWSKLDVLLKIFSFVTVKTYVYILVFITVLLYQALLKIFLSIFLGKKFNHSELKKIRNQMKRLEKMIVLLATFILKMFEFQESIQLFIDAFFYTTAVFALYSQIFESSINTR